MHILISPPLGCSSAILPEGGEVAQGSTGSPFILVSKGYVIPEGCLQIDLTKDYLFE